MEMQADRVTLGSWAQEQTRHCRSVAIHRWGLPRRAREIINVMFIAGACPGVVCC